ncbi:MAG: YceH family protein [Janthinobacterium lividum]
MFVLNPVEARVVGCLIEKEITTPEYYPLSLNALLNACNQKSSRDPLMSLSEAEVRGALFSLEELNLVRVLADARVSKFEHRLRDQLNLRRDEIALVCLLLLRGPQTAAELRARADRLYAFDDNAAAQATLERLAGREDPVTRPFPRQAGAREGRWQQLLTGVQEEPVGAGSLMAEKSRGQDADGMAERLAALEERVRALEQRLAGMGDETATAEQS